MGIEPPQMVLQVYFTGSSTLIRFNYIVQFSQTGRLAVTIGNDELFDSVYRMDQKPGTLSTLSHGSTNDVTKWLSDF